MRIVVDDDHSTGPGRCEAEAPERFEVWTDQDDTLLVDRRFRQVLGVPIDLRACYRSAQLFWGEPRFVAAGGGHIQSLVRPPGNEKARYLTADVGLDKAPEDWMSAAIEHKGTWWEDWLPWLTAGSGELRDAPATLGSDALPPLCDAPGLNVHQSA